MPCYSLALFAALLSGFLLTEVHSHGFLFDPPGRSTVWRIFEGQAPINYDDNALYCGTREVSFCFLGYTIHAFFYEFNSLFFLSMCNTQVQFNSINQGRCGECGDEVIKTHFNHISTA